MIDHHLNRFYSRAICHPFQLLCFLSLAVLKMCCGKESSQSIQNHVKLKRKTRPWLLKAIRDKKVSSLTNAFSLLTVGVTHKFNNFLVIVRITLRSEAAKKINCWSLPSSSIHLSSEINWLFRLFFHIFRFSLRALSGGQRVLHNIFPFARHTNRFIYKDLQHFLRTFHKLIRLDFTVNHTQCITFRWFKYP